MKDSTEDLLVRISQVMKSVSIISASISILWAIGFPIMCKIGQVHMSLKILIFPALVTLGIITIWEAYLVITAIILVKEQ